MRSRAAREHFKRGVAHFDREEWQAALVEFLKSRELLATKANTKNAAICARKVGRFAEALELYDALLRDFPDLPPEDRVLIERERIDLAAAVGTIEIRDAPPGASVSIDGVHRGKIPLLGPIRLSAGTHVVRIVHEGSLPFEVPVDLAGREAAVVSARLVTLTRAGRLRVTERSGAAVEVVIDGAPVGVTPWEGALVPGEHTLILRGRGRMGTQPRRFRVKLDQLTSFELAAEELMSALRVNAQPRSAQIVVDGVPVGHGSWEGRLHAGSHEISVSANGHIRHARRLKLEPGTSAVLPVVLAPSLAQKSRVAFELEAGATLGLLWGGGLAEGCSQECEAPVPLGVTTSIRAAYELASGLGLGIHGGYLRISKSMNSRPDSVRLPNHPDGHGVFDDRLRLGGLLIGADAGYAFGTQWPITARLSVGALVGSLFVTRRGSFVDGAANRYEVSASQNVPAQYLYVAPEMRFSQRLGPRFETGLGLRLMVLTALKMPVWDEEHRIAATLDDGFGYFAANDLTGRLLMFAAPVLSMKYAF